MEQRRSVDLEEALKLTGKLILDTIETTKGEFTPEKREYYKTRPVEFSREVLGSDPWIKQELLMQAIVDNPRISIRSSHGVGKSWFAAEIALWFLVCYYPSTVVTTAPTQRQVQDIIWKEINNKWYQSKLPLGGRISMTRLTMSEKEKWFGTGFTASEHDLDRFQGFHNDNVLVIIDESCGVGKNIYDAIEGLLSSGFTRFIQIGNPTNENTEFGRSFKSPLYKKFNVSSFDLPNFVDFGITEDDIRNGTWKKKIKGDLPRPYLTTPQWVADRFSAWGEANPLYQVRVLGNFPAESEDTFIPLLWIERAQKLQLEASGKKIMGVDVAGLGRDESVATIRQGDVQLQHRVWHHMNPMESTGMVVQCIKEWEPNVVNIDEVGEGSGVVSRLQELGYEVNGIRGSNKAENIDDFYNLRTELYCTLRERLREQRLQLLDDDLLAMDLVNIQHDKPSSKGQTKLETKEKTKERLGKSPDRSDALAFTFYDGPRNLPVSDNIGTIFMESDKDANIFKTSDIEKVNELIDVFIYKTHDLSYDIDRRLFCPECGNSLGLVFYDNLDEMTDSGLAIYFKCIICSEQGGIEKCRKQSDMI